MNSATKKHIQALYPEYVQKNAKSCPIHKDEALILIDNHLFGSFEKRGITSWDYDNRFSKSINTNGKVNVHLSNSDSTGYISMSRNFEPQSDGILVLVANLTLENAENGARVYFENSDEKNIFEVYTKDGFYCVKAETEISTPCRTRNGEVVIKAEFDLDGKCGKLCVDGIRACEFTLSDFTDFARIYISTSKGFDTLSITPEKLYLHKNFAVDETFPTPVYPEDWEESSAYPVPSKNDTYGTCALKFDKNDTAKKYFKARSGKVVFESFFYLPENEDVLTVSFGGKLDVKATASLISCHDLSHNFKHNVWQCIHIEADTEEKTAVIFINGKKKATVPCDADSFSYVSFSFEKNTQNGYLLIDDVRVYNIFDYDDYCPHPEKVSSKDHTVIMSVCSLWHEGSHYGWDCVSPYDECTPLMGYYDEGIPESADWETKFLVEHGVDAIQYCWYATSGNDYSEPIKTPGLAWQQHNGYFYSKYSDMLKFCFMWENARFVCGKMTIEEFKNYLWDYWVEWYFRDPRYLTVDNKVVFHIYIASYFHTTFGSIEKCREILDFMREDIKNYGYDGIIILADADAAHNFPHIAKEVSDLGFDGICHYAWGKTSFNPEYLKTNNTKLLNNMKMSDNVPFLVPTVAAGCNIMGWNNERTPLASTSQHEEVFEYYKELIKKEKYNYNLIYMSTWNEYGEGHWLAPSGHNGFGYADVWRKCMTDAPHGHTDIIPTESQMTRLGHLYNDFRTPIRSWLLDIPHPSQMPLEVVYSCPLDMENWEFGDCSAEKGETGEILMHSTGNDPKCSYKPDMNIPAEDVDYIHFRMKTDIFDTIYVYFTTDEDENLGFTGHKSFTDIIYTKDEYADYYIATSECAKFWTGKIRNIRIDPINGVGESAISLVELVKIRKPETDFDIVTDGVKLNIPYYSKSVENGEYYVAADPQTGIFSANNIFYRWNRFTGKLYLKTCTDTEFEFILDSDKVLVNGEEKQLKKPFDLFDHLPVIPFKFICDNAGIDYSISDGVFAVKIR